MKNLKTGLILFLAVLVSGSVMAKGVVKVEVVPGEKDKTLVDVLDVPNHKFEVELKDNNGKLIYSAVEKSTSFDNKRVYDFSTLDNGKYTFEIKSGDETKIEDLVINNGNIEIVEQAEQISPSFSLDGKFLEFSFPNSAFENVRLLLYDNDTNELVFQETIVPEYDIKQALNLSRLEPGNYKAMLISGGSAFDYEFGLK